MSEKNYISHYDLCNITANWQLKKSKIVLWEYQSLATMEYPDVLCFSNGHTRLLEIKVSRQDFLKDSKKECRIDYKMKYYPSLQKNKIENICGLKWESGWTHPRLQEYVVKKPHLGRERYYVCPSNLIQSEEIKNGFGLYWFNGKTFRIKKESKVFKANIYDEMRILEHAFRKYYCGDGHNILVNGYK